MSREEGTLVAALRAIVGEARAAPAGPELLADATEQRGVAGRADAVASPSETAAVAAARGGKLSEDIVVPVELLAEAIEGVRAIGDRADLPACSWGHAGDGNLHATFLVDRDDPDQLERARAVTPELFALADRLGGALSGEHGIGALKRDELGARWTPTERRLHEAVKGAFDPKGLMNPGKILA